MTANLLAFWNVKLQLGAVRACDGDPAATRIAGHRTGADHLQSDPRHARGFWTTATKEDCGPTACVSQEHAADPFRDVIRFVLAAVVVIAETTDPSSRRRQRSVVI